MRKTIAPAVACLSLTLTALAGQPVTAQTAGDTAASTASDSLSTREERDGSRDRGKGEASKVSFNIPRQALSDALAEWSKQSGLQVLRRDSDNVTELTTSLVSGTYSPAEALGRMLVNTGFKYEFINDRTVRIAPANTLSALHNSEASGVAVAQRVAVAQTEPEKQEKTETKPLDSKESKETIAEIIVTAQKKTEHLQDVPVPVTALAADSLLEKNQVRLQDYFTSVPGLSMVMAGDAGTSPALSIRGLSTGLGLVNPTVGIVVDDVPFSGSSAQTSGSYVPDFDPSDLARVEVLRGPQGTLYGASSLGGLIKYVTIDPSTKAFSGQVTAGANAVASGHEAGYTFRGAVNIPLNDTMAIRASAFTRKDPGYIDNVVGGQKDVNNAKVSGGHVAGLWKPSDDLSVKLSALYQDTRVYGAPYIGNSFVDSTLASGNLQQAAIPGSTFFDNKVQAYSATVNAKAGIVDITSLTSYNINKVDDSQDSSVGFNGLQGLLNDPTVVGVSLQQHMNNTKFTQELRLSIPIGERVTWLLGGFYDHEKNDPSNDTILGTRITGEIAGEIANAAAPYTYEEEAAFTNVTVNFTERFNVQIGARESHIDQNYAPVWTGPFVACCFPTKNSPFVPPPQNVTANAFTYLLTPQFKLTPDWMIYGRLASGYRPGGANVNSTTGVLPGYAPDKTQNYEIGSKGDILDHKLSFDVSVYYIDWKDIQISTVSPVTKTVLFINGSKAKSEGVEISVDAKPFDGFKVSAWVAYNNAVLTQALPVYGPTAVYGPEGDRLPYASRFTGSLALEQSFNLTAGTRGFAGGTVNYVGDRLGDFKTLNNFVVTQSRQHLPGYASINLYAGLSHNSWKLNLYVNNAANRLAYSQGSANGLASTFVPIQPRTVGISVTKTF